MLREGVIGPLCSNSSSPMFFIFQADRDVFDFRVLNKRIVIESVPLRSYTFGILLVYHDEIFY
jgi:hypothetical protein